jgi:probable O-glycosylation ligase (exosortase A-associated)
MRDLLIIGLFMLAMAYTLKKPYIGALAMAVVGFLNPQTLGWGLVRGVPFAAMAVAVTGLGMILQNKEVQLKSNATFIWLVLFLAWGGVCTLNAIHPEYAKEELIRFFKIQIVIFMTLFLINDKHKLVALVWTIALSLGYWGIKGGIFSLATFGAYRIWGPEKTFIGGNNEIGLALLVNLPLFYFLFAHATHKWVKRGLLAAMFFCLCAVVFTYSRGAFLGLIATSGFLWWKSDKKLPMAILGIILIIAAIPFIPQELYDRLETIKTYKADRSAMGRINAWTTAINVANDRVTSGGYRHWSSASFALYAPDPEHVADAHSIYFEVIGELGWIGFFIFFMLHFLNWRTANKTIAHCRGDPNKKWAADLSKMIQVSCIAYYSGGAFLGLAYWDMPYYLMLIAFVTQRIVMAQDETPAEVENDESKKVLEVNRIRRKKKPKYTDTGMPIRS